MLKILSSLLHPVHQKVLLEAQEKVPRHGGAKNIISLFRKNAIILILIHFFLNDIIDSITFFYIKTDPYQTVFDSNTHKNA